jgi:hypothetical protein
LEHLSATDRGVTMFRNQVRRGIRAVRDGRPPAELCHTPGVVSTYCNNTVLRMPPVPDEAEDKRRMRAAGRELAEGYLKQPPLSART